jgi:hypothetical protein
MSDRHGFQDLSRPEVRNALLLNEIGVLLHCLGELSEEFIAGDASFPRHLILRRLTRGKDPRLGADASLASALQSCFSELNLDGDETAIAEAVLREVDSARFKTSSYPGSEIDLEGALKAVSGRSGPGCGRAFDRISQLVREVWSNLSWQRRQEEAIAARRPPFVGVEAFLDGLDELPFVADLIEMQGRTWYPSELLPPEVKLLRILREGEDASGQSWAWHGKRRPDEVRHLYCEVLANQLLEIYNIRKDGPGDLGSWFWKARFYAWSEGALELLQRFEAGRTLRGEELESVRWLAVRPITEWAYKQVRLGRGDTGLSVWDRAHRLASLHKSAAAQALLEGRWPTGSRPSWRVLHVTVQRQFREALRQIKELVEVEYPLGNELGRDECSIRFTCPGLDDEFAEQLVAWVAEAVRGVAGTQMCPAVHVTPRMLGGTGGGAGELSPL